jgi:eukaryotic-like serine/threonine-protein kinase
MALTAHKERLLSVGNCDLFEKIADKQMGAVYKGRNRVTGEVVAVKVMPPFQAGKELAFQRFARECRILSALNDPRIVRALDFGMDGHNPYLVMEFVGGESLGRRIARQGRLPEAEAIQVIGEVAGALDRAHSQGLVHRNVKPDKILITADGKIKLADLSLVRQVETQQGLTRAGTILGTPNFMAPEQLCNASKATPYCDIYSLAATLYMAVTGSLPFGECNLAEMWTRKLQNDLPPPKKLVPALSDGIDRAIRKAMSTSPERRHANCGEFVEDLTGGGACETRPDSVELASDQPLPEPAPLPVHRSNVGSSEGLDTSMAFKPPALTDQYESDGAGFSLLISLAATSVLVAGFLSGLFLFSR